MKNLMCWHSIINIKKFDVYEKFYFFFSRIYFVWLEFGIYMKKLQLNYLKRRRKNNKELKKQRRSCINYVGINLHT